jgi:ectoine hydroxylase-related dioxygenase (phytanoyl-CoA dioxygenase family)
MTARIAQLPASGPASDLCDALREDGAVIIEDLLGTDLLARFNRELDPLMAGVSPERSFVNPAIDHFFGKRTRHLSGLAAHSDVFAREILPHPVYEAIANDVLAKSCSSYILNLAHVMDRGPGAEQQLFHRDHDIWPHLPKPHPEVMLASVIALVDFDAENGATRIVPGSHRWHESRKPKDDEIAVAEMKAGSAVVYLGSAIHAGGANISRDRHRRGMHVSFAAGWLRTEENQYLSVPIEKIRAMPRRSQELLGYGVHDAIAVGGGYLGTVDLVSPADLVESGRL